MRLLKWTPDFDVREESPIAPTDQATASVSRPSVARVLVELDVSKKYPIEIWIGSEVKGYFQKVELENLPIFCSFCKMHGHAVNECFKKFLNLRVEKKHMSQSDEFCCTEKEKEKMLESTEIRSSPVETNHGNTSDVPSEVMVQKCLEQEAAVNNCAAIDSLTVVENAKENYVANMVENMGNSLECNNVLPIPNDNGAMDPIVEQENISLYVHLIGEEDDNIHLSLEEGEINPSLLPPKANSATLKVSALKDNDHWSDDGKFMEDDGSTIFLEGMSPNHSI
ncbi:hypothetical protein MA16_Dca026151 [Dendrobium catenatum]|uniref:DUF4283 domain-containing protein n=1 Tax=Dendrobium catenatum TaxID=906689 RepID=A0A2I0WIF4_9ASPA|nr:hypothetical protein MA16_Dca026151 [Dendrobium catenatum]